MWDVETIHKVAATHDRVGSQVPAQGQARGVYSQHAHHLQTGSDQRQIKAMQDFALTMVFNGSLHAVDSTHGGIPMRRALPHDV